MRFVAMGLGAVGGTVAALLVRAGHEVLGIARGAHLDVIAANGLTLSTPRERFTVRFPVAAAPTDFRPQADDVVLLGMKTQDTPPALDALRDAGFDGASIVCLQNGVENERLALRLFARVFGVCVVLPSTYLTPGLVEDFGHPHPGILDVGRWPGFAVNWPADPEAGEIAAAFRSAGFQSVATAAIARLKYGKLLMNLGNALEVCCGPGPHWLELYAKVRAEAEVILKSAGVDFASADEDRTRRGDFRIEPIDGKKRDGGSTWQSVTRGTGSVETDYLNGEIVSLAHTQGLEAPLNAALIRLSRAVARGVIPPGALTPDMIR